MKFNLCCRAEEISWLPIGERSEIVVGESFGVIIFSGCDETMGTGPSIVAGIGDARVGAAAGTTEAGGAIEGAKIGASGRVGVAEGGATGT
jgi:hypothetical protein